jgi:hypothetical protein
VTSPWPPTELPDVFAAQRRACEQSGSQLYVRLIEATVADVAAGGPCADVLRPHEHEPFATALPLRFLGAIHWLVLSGRAPPLARHYPSAGGAPGPTVVDDPYQTTPPPPQGESAASRRLVDDFLATVAERRDEIESRIHLGVQTNEVGRSGALVGGFVEVVRRSGLPLRVLEVGASGGLNLRWDHYFYDTGESTFGDPDSPVRFVGVWEGQLPRLDGVRVEVAERAGCDRSPIDVTTEDGRRTLRSYIWPDEVDRLDRLDAALAVAARVPAPVEAADLGEWIEDRLASPALGVATVVVHSIVWQYVARPARDRLRGALRRAGSLATPGSPVAWLRMEPTGRVPVADLRLTWWPGGEEQVLGTVAFQGAPVWWGTPSPRDAPRDARG